MLPAMSDDSKPVPSLCTSAVRFVEITGGSALGLTRTATSRLHPGRTGWKALLLTKRPE